jgi:hypothetical protein
VFRQVPRRKVLAWSGLFIAAVVVVVVVVAAIYVIFWPVSDRIAKHDVGAITGRGYGAALQAARDAARGRLVAFGAGLFAVGALIYTARNFTLSRRTFELTEQGQVTDRYTKAIEQLGSDRLDVRIGGIYALERVARDSPRDHPTVMEVLTAFIREHSREPWPLPDPDNPDQPRLTRPDVQAAVTVAGRRDVKRDILSINLAGADLTRADLTRASLTQAHLDGANLDGADLRDASLTRADLRDANLRGAHLGAAYLISANLRDANLDGAHLLDAYLMNAFLINANLTRADLRDASLRGADLTGADLRAADLTGARWPEGVPVPDGLDGRQRFRPPEPCRPVIRGNDPLPLITRRSADQRPALRFCESATRRNAGDQRRLAFAYVEALGGLAAGHPMAGRDRRCRAGGRDRVGSVRAARGLARAP